MYVVTVLFEVEPADAERFFHRVTQQARDSLEREEACHRFDVCRDPERPERVFLYELYDDKAAFDLHLASPHFLAFDRDAGPITRSKRVEIYELA